MLQNGCKPSFAMPAEKVMACPSAMPTSKVRSGISFIIMFIEQPVGMAGVTPTMRGLLLASSKRVCPNTSWNFGGLLLLSCTRRCPVSGSNFPGACHTVALFSAGLYPLPFVVCRCSSFGPFIFLSWFNTLTTSLTSCPSNGPK